MNYCARCGAKLRQAKPPWAVCDPCDDAQHRDNVKHEAELERARLAAAGERACKHCGERPAVVRSGIYAWLCGACRDQARITNGQAA